MHTVAVLAVQDVIAFDLATPLEVFGWAHHRDGSAAYRTLVCGDETSAGPLAIRPGAGLSALAAADTIVVPGSRFPDRPQPPETLQAIRAAHDRGVRLASICVGAFTLAQAGLLDGAVATTHWAAAELFRDLHPQVMLELGSMSRVHENVYTSAGAAAGLDLCLELIGLDYGPDVAADAARHAVMPLNRDGGQSPFITDPRDTVGGDLDILTSWLDERLGDMVSLDMMAARINVSVRTLNRRFNAAYGSSPVSWLLLRRVRRAQELLIMTSDSVEEIAGRVGFASAITLRAQFKNVVGMTPTRYRRSFTHKLRDPLAG